jgi:hypothetical protein
MNDTRVKLTCCILESLLFENFESCRFHHFEHSGFESRSWRVAAVE